LKKLRESRAQAERSGRSIEDAWSKQPGNAKFLQLKSELGEQIQALTDLPNDEKRQLQKLALSIKEAQLRRHLDRYLIANGKISKIGSGRKAVLASFGVQTAADIERHRISAIQGFGPALVSSLVAWRQSVEGKFVFNPKEPINPNDIATVKAGIVRRKTELENKIRTLATSLQQASESSLSQRAKITTLANQAFAARKQAEVNEQSATGPLHKASKIITFCCIGFAAVALLANQNSRVTETRPAVVAKKMPDALAAPLKEASSTKQSQPSASIAPPVEPSIWSPPQPAASNNASQDKLAAGVPTPTYPSELGTSRAPQAAVTLSLSKAEDVLKIQRRLFELGFLWAAADGKWGVQSKHALLEYKDRAGLERSDDWDAAVERSLFADSAPHVVRTLPFVGGWTNEPGQCGEAGTPAPVRITATRAETSSGACTFNSVTADGNRGWRVEAMCGASGQAPHLAHVRLVVKGSILHWSSDQPETLYYPCENVR
jgi:hypothetical protein